MIELSEYKINSLRNKIRNSNFNRDSYQVNIPLKTLNTSLLEYINSNPNSPKMDSLNPQTMKDFVAPFQREYKSWTQKMKIAYVENLVLGLKSTIDLYTIADPKTKSPFTDCYLLDGQHRMYAILEFINGDFNIFNNQFSYEELIKERVLTHTTGYLTIKLYTFLNESEAINFYIQMNENITHTPEDIQIALDYLQKQ